MESSVVSAMTMIVFFDSCDTAGSGSHSTRTERKTTGSIAAQRHRGGRSCPATKQSVRNLRNITDNAMLRKCFTVCAFVIFVSLSCITRNNPFDPINSPALFPGVRTLVSNADTLAAKIFSASAGDTIVVAPGIYHVSLRFNNSGTADKPIVVLGSDTGSVLRAQPTLGILYISAQHSLRFQYMTFD